MRPTSTPRSWTKAIGLAGLTLAALTSTGCGRMGGGLSVQGPGINVQVGPLGYSSGSMMPPFRGQGMPGTQFMDPRYAYAGQVLPNGQAMDPNQMAAMQQGYPPNGQFMDPNQIAAQQQAGYSGQNPSVYPQPPVAYQAAAPTTNQAAPTTQAVPTTQTASAIPGSGLVASPFAPGTTQPLAGPVQARFG